jgi:hypothetical protein
VVQGARESFGNVAPGAPTPNGWALQNPVLYVFIWVALFLAVFVPLAVRTYGRTASR